MLINKQSSGYRNLFLMGCSPSSRTPSPAFYDEAVRGRVRSETSRSGHSDKPVRRTTRPRADRLLSKDNINLASRYRQHYRYHAEQYGKFISVHIFLSEITAR